MSRQMVKNRAICGEGRDFFTMALENILTKFRFMMNSQRRNVDLIYQKNSQKILSHDMKAGIEKRKKTNL